MAIVKLDLGYCGYEIIIEPGCLGRLGSIVKGVAGHGRAAVLADSLVGALYGQVAVGSMAEAGFDVFYEALTTGEREKHLGTVGAYLELLADERLERKSPVVALGGGVTGDTVGYVAASYLRGVPFVQCPTTLLSMVDASVGGKVGVNLKAGKNLAGAFYQPRVVVIDTDTLKTLPKREVRCGLAECVKHGVIRDPELFDWIGAHVDQILGLDSDTLVELVKRNVEIKAKVVIADEKEAGVRAHLNYGHTFAHAIEKTADYGRVADYHHGEAVSLGMVAATRLAENIGMCDKGLSEKLVGLLDLIGLPTWAGNLVSTEELMGVMTIDKKVSDGKVRLVLPVGMGEVKVVSDVADGAIVEAWESLRG